MASGKSRTLFDIYIGEVVCEFFGNIFTDLTKLGELNHNSILDTIAITFYQRTTSEGLCA